MMFLSTSVVGTTFVFSKKMHTQANKKKYAIVASVDEEEEKIVVVQKWHNKKSDVSSC